MTEDINTKYSSYVHIGNSGIEITVQVEQTEKGYAAQFLTTSLHSFGMPHETKMWIDDNVLDALEYIVEQAREQRKYIPELNNGWNLTHNAIPPHSREETYSGESCCDSLEDDKVN